MPLWAAGGYDWSVKSLPCGTPSERGKSRGKHCRVGSSIEPLKRRMGKTRVKGGLGTVAHVAKFCENVLDLETPFGSSPNAVASSQPTTS